MINVSQTIESHLSGEILRLLREIGEVASARGESVYLVGGVVRDLLLGQANLDLDLVVEGRAIALARQIAGEKGWSVRTHPRFGTAKLCGKDLNLDLVTARSETYARPGALPTVGTGTIQDDLSRRDFTINAMAVCLRPDSFGELLDLNGGQHDLQNGLIRVLHRGSFSDDPTRILRALRYEQRLNFRLEKETAGALGRHLDSLDTVTGERLWHELDLILREKFPEKVLSRADELGVLQKIYPALRSDDWLAEAFVQARNSGDESLSLPSVYLALLAWRLTQDECEGCIARLKMPGWAARTVRATARLKLSLSSLTAPELRASEIYRCLERYVAEAVEAATIATDSPLTRQRLGTYLNKLRYVKPSLGGDDLQSMGIAQGKRMGRILRALHDARLNQEVSSREGEQSLARRLLGMPEK